MRNRMWFGIVVGLAIVVGAIPRDALAIGGVHASTWLKHKNGAYKNCDQRTIDYGSASCSNTLKVCNPFCKTAFATASAYYQLLGYSPWRELKLAHNISLPNNKFTGDAHADHHSTWPFSNAATLACCVDTVIPEPVPGDSATAEIFRITCTDDSAAGNFHIRLDSTSFLQVYLVDLLPGDSIVANWMLIINSDTSSIRLVGRVFNDGVSVVPSMDGLFTGLPYTLTDIGNGAHALRLGSVDFTVPGSVENTHIEALAGEGMGTIPTLSEWGAIIFGTLLLGSVAFYIWRRRRVVTA